MLPKSKNPWWLSVALILFVGGCSEDTRIRSYTVAKAKSSGGALDGALAAEAKPAQLLGMIVPHDQNAWFLKMTDDPTRVQQLDNDFRMIAQSLSFDNDGSPRWQLADGWNQQVMRQITYAKFSRDDGATITLTQLGATTNDPGQWQDYLKDNINRWRQQLNLEPADWPEIETELEEVPSHSTETAKAYFVSLTGKQAAGGAPMAPFAPFAGRGQTSQAPNDDVHSNLAVDGDRPRASGEPEPKRLQLTYQVPEGWQEQPTSGIRLAHFEIPGEPTKATVSISTAGGDIEQSIGMWLQQIGSTSNEDQIQRIAEAAISADSKLGDYRCYTITGGDGASQERPNMAIRVAVIPLASGESLFVKLTGSGEQVDQLSNAMDQLIESLDTTQ